MSEGSTSSAPAEKTTESTTVSNAPGKKRSLGLMIIAIIVVLILLGSAAYVLMKPKGPSFSVTMSPSSLVSDAGRAKIIAVYPMDGKTNLTGSSDVTYSWSFTPSSLGSLSLFAKQKTNFTASVVAGSGTIKCSVKYKGLTENVSASVTILPPFLDQVAVSPSVKTLGHNVPQTFTATAISSVGSALPGVSFIWDFKGLPSANYTSTVDSTTQNATFTSGTMDVVNATLNATATYQGVTKTGTALITITLEVKARSVSYLWYDMFNVPFKSYWNWRAPEEVLVTHSYPYIYTYEVITHNLYYYSDLRLNMSAKNLTSVSTTTDQLFFPQGLFNGFQPLTKGGTMTLDWSMDYPTMAEMNATTLGSAVIGSFDGWIVELKGNITLDREAALSVLGGGARGLTPAILDGNSFSSWWAGVKSDALINWHTWLNVVAGPAAKYDVFPMYNYDIDPLAGSIDAVKVGDKVILMLDDYSWAMECVMARWLHHAFNPTEWFMYDFKMHAVIGPEVSNIQVDAAVMYVVYAYETVNIPLGQIKGEPDWVFEPCLGDAYYSRGTWPGEHSQMDPYRGLTYVNNAPGSGFYNQSMAWDYTPAAFNLTTNETMKIQWPAGNIIFYKGIAANVAVQVNGSIVVNYGEPITKDMPSKIKIDNINRMLTYTGPIDMWTWSKTQTADKDLSDLWNSTGNKVLPQGAPFIEFKIDQVPPSVPWRITLTNITNPVLRNATTSIRATVWDQYGQVLTGYTGTVSFTANRTGATLPANYAFTLADRGTHVFAGLSFSGLWNYTVSVRDVARPAVNGSLSHIMVIPSPQTIGHFDVLGIRNMNGGDRSNVRVIAYDQYGMRFVTYTGTVNFTTNATSAYARIANYTFLPSDHGDKNFSLVVSFEVRGVYSVTVKDTVNTLANGTQMNIIISSPPSVTYTAYDFFKEPWHEWWYERAKYEWDIVLSNVSGNYTLIYNKDSSGQDGLIYAPYRWNTTSYNMTTLGVSTPEFMPVYNSTGKMVHSYAAYPGAAVNMTVHWNYLNWTWWNQSIYPQWHNNPDWFSLVDQSGTNPNSTMWAQVGHGSVKPDGYYLADIITATMNREAALTWLNLSMSTPDPVAWWNAMSSTGFTNGENYVRDWRAWVMYEGNHRLDVYAGYASAYYDYGTMGNLTVLPNGDVKLSILHFNGGMEVLTTRWIMEAQICQHQPYAEDFTMAVKYYADARTDLTYDEVAEWNFHAVMSHGIANGSSWVWEPQKIDYDATSGHPSDFTIYSTLAYPDYNSGDPNGYGFPYGTVWGTAWGSPVAYENAPAFFNLTSYQTLILKMPNHDVVGYLGRNVSLNAMTNITYNHDYSDYNAITVHGTMSLGYYLTNPFGAGANLSQMWDNTTKVLTIHGPQLFDQYHWQIVGYDMWNSPIWAVNYSAPGTGPLLHGAPWIEFNMMNGSTLITSKTTSVASGGATPSMPSTVSADLLALASVACGMMLAVAALAVGMRRFRET